ncbi:MAG: DUF4926 domain-containing protein [Acholeplasmataceae bacterium]|jgi:hypothetical protein|nr:DUF4926 domain-containing protein [Bacilli bacterium]NLB84767.1 DUF4926 domain-containing protein [Acholeplasmataceae bacterium]
MKELDTVILIKKFKNLKKGTIGCIVLKYDENNFEVEFFNQSGDTIDVYTITSDYLALKEILIMN